MSKEKFQISARDVAKRMDETAKKVLSGEANVNVGLMAIGEFKAIINVYRLQLEQSKITGKPINNPLVNMD